MSSRRSVRQIVVAVLLGVLVGGGLMAVTPAGAEVTTAVATNWKKVWKKHLRPLADRRYYTKAQSDTKYQPRGAYEAAGSGYSKAESDAKYAAAGSSYSKAEIDSKLAPFVNSVAASAGGDQALSLTTTDTVVRSVSIMPPADGAVVVSSSAYIWALVAGDVVARCSLTTGNTLDASAFQYVNMPGAAVAESDAIAGTRGFSVTKGNLLTVNLVCDEFTGDVTLSDSWLTAIFAPN